MKGIVLFAAACALPAVASAQDEEGPLSVTAGASTSYMFEKQAYDLNGPVAHVGVTYEASESLSFNVWGQVGEHDLATEIDLTGTFSKDVGGVTLSATGGVYLYPRGGSKPIWVVSGSASIPAGPVAFDLGVDHYEGGLESTSFSAAIAADISGVRISAGKAANVPEDLYPWFARVSVPLGKADKSPRLGVRGFWGAGSAVTLDLSYSF